MEDIAGASGKTAVLDMLKVGHRVLLFSQFTSVLNILEDYCKLRGWRHCRFDGSTPWTRRKFTARRFNSPDSCS